MFGTVSKWIGVYNIWYYGVFMALNGKPEYFFLQCTIIKYNANAQSNTDCGRLTRDNQMAPCS